MKNLYLSLALDGIKNNRKHYLPFFISSVGMVMVSFILYSLATGAVFKDAYAMTHLQILLKMADWILRIFILIFLYYTYSHLLTQRTKELAVYQVLGMKKKHLRRILRIEDAILCLGSLGVGLILSSLLYKLSLEVFFRFIDMEGVTTYFAPAESYRVTIAFFILVYLFIYFRGRRMIGRQSPKDLMVQDKVYPSHSKKESFVAILGVIFLAIGYTIALKTQNPVNSIAYFFIAVLFVMIGTYCFFYGTLIFIIQLLKKNKRYYYRSKNFAAISGLAFRMRENAMGLASICLLGTAAMVLISSALGLGMSAESIISRAMPRNYQFKGYISAPQTENLINMTEQVLRNGNIDTKDSIKLQSLNTIVGEREGKIEASDESVNEIDFNEQRVLWILPESIMKENRLEDGQAIYYNNHPDHPLPFDIQIGDENLQLISAEDKFKYYDFLGQEIRSFVESDYLVVSDTMYEKLRNMLLTEGWTENYNLYFESESNPEDIAACANEVNDQLKAKDIGYLQFVDGNELRLDFHILYGGLYFVGIFLGIIFIFGLGLVIYYKQLTEGYEDIRRFDIMQQVGMNEQLVRQTIKTQVRTVFFLPLGVAIVHILVAYPILGRMLSMLSLKEQGARMLSMAIVILAFILIYTLIYKLTSKVYYNIVNRNRRVDA